MARQEPLVPMDFKPITVSWNITRRCNLLCEHCYIDASPGQSAAGELSTEEALAVVDDLATLNPELVLILTGGEPLLRKDLPAVITHAASKGFLVVLGTNGTFVDEHRAAELKDLGLSGVGVSIDSIDPSRHDAFRGQPGAFAKTLKGMRAMRAQRVDFLVEMSLTKENAGEVEAVARLAAAEGARAFNLFFLVPVGRGKEYYEADHGLYEEMFPRLHALQQAHAGAMMVNAKCAPHFRRYLYEHQPASPLLSNFLYGGCPAGLFYAAIGPTGDVHPCPYMDHPVGNVRRQPFSEIWRESGTLQALRARQLGGRCGDCEFRLLCGGCRCRALGATGDLLGEDPGCTFVPGTVSAAVIQPQSYGAYGVEARPKDRWTAGARERLGKIPFFARGMVTNAVESYADRHGIEIIDEAIMASIREQVAPRFLRP